MGKSNKKVKSDRINALRKQYDAFLEEDKKRKERNEYILGRLDKMRYSTALVPVRKSSPLMNRSSTVYHLGYQQEAPIVTDFQPSVINRNHVVKDISIPTVDNTYIFQEISKNYILIPKLRPSIMHTQPAATIHRTDTGRDIHVADDIKTRDLNPSSNENTDWKSKYEILNILKKEENEKQTVQFANDSTPEAILNQEAPYNNIYEKTVVKCDNDLSPETHIDTGYKYLEELPEKDIPIEKVNYEPEMNDEIKDNTFLIADSISHINTNENTGEVLPASIDPVTEIDYKLQNTNLEQNYSSANDYSESNLTGEITNYHGHDEYNYTEAIVPHVLPTEQTEYVEHYEPVYEENTLPGEHFVEPNVAINENLYHEREDDVNLKPEILAEQFKSEEPQTTYVDEQDANQTQVITTNELVNELNQNPGVLETKPEYVEYATEDIDNQEMQPHVEVHMKTTVDSIPGQNVVEQTTVDQMHDQAPPAETGPETQEAPGDQEQTVNEAAIEDFDAEQRELFYTEHSAENYDYQQENPVTLTQEYPMAYQQNQDYAYYENNQPEATESEEQFYRYDPSYHQQYVDSYEKVYEEQKPQQYEEPQNYEQVPPEQMELVYDQQENVPGVIEAALDTEEGYVEKKPEADNKEQTDNTKSSPEPKEQVA